MTDKKELDMTEHEKCIHYPVCLVNNYIHNRCGYYLEGNKQGEWIDEGLMADGHPHHAFRCPFCESHIIRIPDETPKYCENCGADMRKEGEAE